MKPPRRSSEIGPKGTVRLDRLTLAGFDIIFEFNAAKYPDKNNSDDGGYEHDYQQMSETDEGESQPARMALPLDRRVAC